MQVSEGVQQMKIPMRFNPLGYTYSYLLSSSKHLIDTGVSSKDAFTALEKHLSEFGLRPRDIEGIIITHMHNDHVGLVNYLKELGNVQVLAHEIAIERQRTQVEQYQDMYKHLLEELILMGGGAFQQMLARFENSFREPPAPLPIDRALKDGEEIRLENAHLKAIWTPGHAAEHICLHNNEKRILFSGDHVLPKITSHISLHTWENRNPLNDYMLSLEKVGSLNVDLVLPAHEQTFTNLKERVFELKTHHIARLNEVKDSLRQGDKTVFQVAGRIHWDSRPWPLMDFWTKRMAAAETYAHLIYLRNKGEVNETNKEGTLFYSLNAKP